MNDEPIFYQPKQAIDLLVVKIDAVDSKKILKFSLILLISQMIPVT